LPKKNEKNLPDQKNTDLFRERPHSRGKTVDIQEKMSREEALLQVLPDLIFVLNAEGVFLDYHTPDPDLLLVPPREFLGKHFRTILPPEIAEKLDSALRRILETGGFQSFEYPLTISGKRHYFEARLVGYGREKILAIIRDITDRIELEESLRDNREKYRQLVDYAPTGLYEIDFWEQKLVSVNDVMCDYLGYTKEELLSNNFNRFLPEESRKLFADRLQKMVKNQPVPNVVEFKMSTKDGREIWILIHPRYIYQQGDLKGAFVVAQDITQRKLAEEALRESEGHLRSLMENAKDFAIYRLLNRDKTLKGTEVVFVSPSLETILGPTDPLKFETWFDNTHPDDLERIKQARIAALVTLKFDEEMRIFHPREKEWRWVRATSNGFIDPDGQTIYINGIIRDITNKKKAEKIQQETHDHLEDLVKQRTNQLSKTNEKLILEIKERKQIETALGKSEKKLRLLSNKLINAQEDERKRIAMELHDELGQSLIGLKFHLSSFPIKDRSNPKGLKDEIEQSLKQLDLMTEKVRRLSRELRPSVLEHLGLNESLAWLFAESSRTFSYNLINQFPESLPSFSREQDIIIFRIFQEALTNIGKHAKAGEVIVGMSPQGEEVKFYIRDNGAGFKIKELSRRGISERGLGLTAMAERARMAGGNLILRSREGKGTQITFTIPVKKSRRLFQKS